MADTPRAGVSRELDQRTIARQLDYAAAVLGDLRLDELLAQRLQARDRAGLVSAHEATVADHVRGQNRRQPAFDVVVQSWPPLDYAPGALFDP